MRIVVIIVRNALMCRHKPSIRYLNAIKLHHALQDDLLGREGMGV